MKKGHFNESEVAAERNPLGRPSLPPDRVRSQRVVTFMTQHELECLKALAEQNRESLSSTCRKILTERIGKQTHP